MSRKSDLRRFYDLLSEIRRLAGGARSLASLDRSREWPRRGVYFFFEHSEVRGDSSAADRVVRVGTHGLAKGSQSSLSQRLSQHRGGGDGRGNHRGSIFRLLVGQAMQARGEVGKCVSWGVRGDAAKASLFLGIDHETLREGEAPIERAVSGYIGAMPVLWLGVEDAPGSDSERGFIERNSIALLSNYQREPLDTPSANWLGLGSDRPLVRASGLWNQRHVEEAHDPAFLGVFERWLDR